MVNHLQITGFIFMLLYLFLFRNLKMNKNKHKSSIQYEWLTNGLYITWVKKIYDKHRA